VKINPARRVGRMTLAAPRFNGLNSLEEWRRFRLRAQM
jgi:hypothetical protein